MVRSMTNPQRLRLKAPPPVEGSKRKLTFKDMVLGHSAEAVDAVDKPWDEKDNRDDDMDSSDKEDEGVGTELCPAFLFSKAILRRIRGT
ncbi:hypothetical protein CDL15_Pgr004752 [Punica granatum]|uniref:Uncharacterized protein n=1 Tax=Punica granatum TaxID=22663 RepID=A0A218W7H3_PUNGR|nr:hypothetical protein CDL15_Pgr004752 [Punica granatum]